jgi:L-amino acid N-acyltransferase YncA
VPGRAAAQRRTPRTRPRMLRPNVSGATVREASEDDAPACAAIYAPYVRETAVSFEGEPPTPAQIAERIAAATRTHAWVVLEDDDRLVGYAYGGLHQERAAYRFSCEVSVYVEQDRRRTGLGRALYEALFKRLVARGYRMVVAGMTLPNEASVGLHRAMGFEPVGVYRRIGWKLGAWHDVAWMQRALGVEQDPPPEPLRRRACLRARAHGGRVLKPRRLGCLLCVVQQPHVRDELPLTGSEQRIDCQLGRVRG